MLHRTKVLTLAPSDKDLFQLLSIPQLGAYTEVVSLLAVEQEWTTESSCSDTKETECLARQKLMESWMDWRWTHQTHQRKKHVQLALQIINPILTSMPNLYLWLLSLPSFWSTSWCTPVANQSFRMCLNLLTVQVVHFLSSVIEGIFLKICLFKQKLKCKSLDHEIIYQNTKWRKKTSKPGLYSSVYFYLYSNTSNPWVVLQQEYDWLQVRPHLSGAFNLYLINRN